MKVYLIYENLGYDGDAVVTIRTKKEDAEYILGWLTKNCVGPFHDGYFISERDVDDLAWQEPYKEAAKKAKESNESMTRLFETATKQSGPPPDTDTSSGGCW